MSIPVPRARNYRAELMLLLLTLIWGSTFPAIKASLDYASPLVFVCLRFSAATLLFCLAFPHRVVTLPRATLRDGLLLGLLMGGAFMAQTLGLGRTTASRSGFLTALYVPFTPLLQVAFGRGMPRAGVLAGASLVVIGLYLLASPPDQPLTGMLETLWNGLNAGDWWTILCALLFALYLIGMDIWAGRHDALQLTFMQLAASAAIAGASAPFFETMHLEPSFPLSVGIAYLALFASLGAIFVQTRYQRETSPARAAIIFAMEAVFSALLSAIFLKEWLGLYGMLGGLLIISGLLAAELTHGR
jgi:drug/metabolite transporter (DMT)-like permease